ncbi:MAG: LysM peptidoglycan-binding domain-containing protein [Bdellovibrionales bacterium]|nr:LysM peptidoglycan-binding domain-containing protein [Bdellovibrionales bacterium]
MKKIFIKPILVFLCCACFIFLIFSFTYVVAQEEDDEDIEWLDDEEELESLQPESDMTDSAKTTPAPKEEQGEGAHIPDAGLSDDEETESADSFDTDTIADEISSPDETIAEAGVTTDSVVDIYEQNLYETYIRYYSKRVSAEEWSSVVGGKDIYVIQPKDTLWDISKVLFGDPNYWPKLWSTNPAITNPHLIQPEGNLGFIYGTEGTPPSVNLVQGGIGGVPESKAPPPPPDFLKGKKVTVPSSHKTLPIMKNIPASLPPLYMRGELDDENSDLQMSFEHVKKLTMAFLRYYVSDEPPSGQGVISSQKEYGTQFHTGQRLILEMRDPVNPGQKLAVMHNKGKLVSSIRGVRGPFGYQVEVQGEVEVIGRVPDSFDLYEAKVTKSFSPITKRAIVSDRNLIQFDYKTTDLMGSAEAQIIGFPSIGPNIKSMASPYSLVYLNRGLASGLSVGQMYQVKANLSVQRKASYGYDIKVGEVKIIYTEDRFATGVITEMDHPIHTGDFLVSLSAGLSTQSGYDPFDEVEEEVGAKDAAGFDGFEKDSEAVDLDEKEPYEEEDVFEAFE